ncbi:MAG: glutamate ABC transporter substrate-binding protein [Actinomycetales bacterium]
MSYRPLTSIPAPEAVEDPTTAAILRRGFLVVGVSDDTQLLGARNPITGQLEGFDIDVARALAQAMFGDPERISYRVISASDRAPLLDTGGIDVVARNMTMTCARWEQVNFSIEYLAAEQKVLVRTSPGADPPSQSLGDLSGHRVCAPVGTSSYQRLTRFAGVIPVGADSHTACLVLFQQGKVDAITGDEPVLAGLVAQDPYAAITTAGSIADEPYALGLAHGETYFTQYVNRALLDWEADGGWQDSYDRWLEPSLGRATAPRPRYGEP